MLHLFCIACLSMMQPKETEPEKIRTHGIYPPVWVTETVEGKVRLMAGEHPNVERSFWRNAADTVKFIPSKHVVSLPEYGWKQDLSGATTNIFFYRSQVMNIFPSTSGLQSSIPYTYGINMLNVRRNRFDIETDMVGTKRRYERNYAYETTITLHFAREKLSRVSGIVAWKYHYRKGELRKATLKDRPFSFPTSRLWRIFDADNRLTAEVVYSGRLSQSEVRQYHEIVATAFAEKESFSDLGRWQLLWRDRYFIKDELEQIIFYTYDGDKLSSALFWNGDDTWKYEMTYNTSGLLTDLKIRRPEYLQHQFQYVYDEQQRVIEKRERNCGTGDCHGDDLFALREMSFPYWTYKYAYNDKGMMQSITCENVYTSKEHIYLEAVVELGYE